MIVFVFSPQIVGRCGNQQRSGAVSLGMCWMCFGFCAVCLVGVFWKPILSHRMPSNVDLPTAYHSIPYYPSLSRPILSYAILCNPIPSHGIPSSAIPFISHPILYPILPYPISSFLPFLPFLPFVSFWSSVTFRPPFLSCPSFPSFLSFPFFPTFSSFPSLLLCLSLSDLSFVSSFPSVLAFPCVTVFPSVSSFPCVPFFRFFQSVPFCPSFPSLSFLSFPSVLSFRSFPSFLSFCFFLLGLPFRPVLPFLPLLPVTLPNPPWASKRTDERGHSIVFSVAYPPLHHPRPSEPSRPPAVDAASVAHAPLVEQTKQEQDAEQGRRTYLNEQTRARHEGGGMAGGMAGHWDRVRAEWGREMQGPVT